LGLENKNLTFNPPDSRKTAILGTLLTGLGKFSAENRFTMGRGVLVGGSRGTSPSLDLTFPPIGKETM